MISYEQESAPRTAFQKKTFTINGKTKEALVVITEIIGYDGQERTVYIRHANGNEWWCEYEFRADGTLERETTYRLADCPMEKAKRNRRRRNLNDYIEI